MTDGIGADDITDPPERDFRRGAGGAPLVRNAEGTKDILYSRCSSLGDTLDETSGLNKWLTCKAMEGVADRPELVAKIKTITPYEDHKKEWQSVREEAINAGRGSFKADLGTAIHKMSERWEQEPTYDPGEPYNTVLEAYEKAMADLGLVSELYECKVVNDEFRSAGTFDRLVRTTRPLIAPDDTYIGEGTFLILDLKTGSLEYALPGYAVQSALYAGGALYDLENERRLPTPDIHQGWAIIAHLDLEAGTCEMLWIDLEVGRAGAQMAEDVREWRRAWRRKDGFKAGVQPVQTAPDDYVAPAARTYTVAELKGMKKAELFDLAKERDLHVAKGTLKADLVVLLADDSEPQPEVESNHTHDLSAPPAAVHDQGVREHNFRSETSAIPARQVERATLDELVAFGRERVKALAGHDKARDWAIARWPKELPPPQRCETEEQILEVLAFIDKVETEFSLPFPGGDPRQRLEVS